jgi:hypothetical protein
MWIRQQIRRRSSVPINSISCLCTFLPGCRSSNTNQIWKKSIPYEYKAGIESCTTAAEIWLAFQQRYAFQSREDELRLEGQLLDFKKTAKDSIDQHISKFDSLIASIIAQQPPAQRYDDSKKNRYFLQHRSRACVTRGLILGWASRQGSLRKVSFLCHRR